MLQEKKGTMPKSEFLDHVRSAIRMRHLSKRTEDAYIGWIHRYIVFHNKTHPAKLAEEHVETFLTHLAVKEKASASTQNQALQ